MNRLDEIRSKFDVICEMAETDPQAATTGAALRYSMDIPFLLNMIDELQSGKSQEPSVIAKD